MWSKTVLFFFTQDTKTGRTKISNFRNNLFLASSSELRVLLSAINNSTYSTCDRSCATMIGHISTKTTIYGILGSIDWHRSLPPSICSNGQDWGGFNLIIMCMLHVKVLPHACTFDNIPVDRSMKRHNKVDVLFGWIISSPMLFFFQRIMPAAGCIFK